MTAVTEPSGEQLPEPAKIKLDLGCGTKKKKDFVGIDKIAFEGVDIVTDLGKEPWPFADGSVAEAHTCHFVEHLDRIERVFFVNELYRVLEKGGKCELVVPNWCSSRAYGDPTHQWPPMGEFWFFYLDQAWRDREAPHTDAKHWPQGFKCNFEVTWGYGLHPSVMQRNSEFVQFAINYYKEAAIDIHATLTKI